jgi:CBS domain containing-hemolysin-like protein
MFSILISILLVFLFGALVTLSETVLLANPEEDSIAEEGGNTNKLERFKETADSIYETAEFVRFAIFSVGIIIAESFLRDYLSESGIALEGIGWWIPVFLSAVPIASLFWVISIYMARGFGEKYWEKLTPLVYFVLLFLDSTGKVFTFTLKRIAKIVLKPFKAIPNYSVTLVSEEHIKRLLNAGLKKGDLDEEEHEILGNVLEFNDLTAYEVMIPRTEMSAVELTGNSEHDFKEIIRTGYSSVPIFEDSLDNITGIVNVKELMRYFIVNNDFEISRAIRPPHFVPETKYISELLKEMQLKGIRAAVVTDEYGGTEGIIKLEDILSEIVGDITYKTEGETEEITPLPDGSYIVLGIINVGDFNDYFDADIPESDEYSTISGFISDFTGKILNKGDITQYQGLSFELTKRVKNKMAEFRVIRPSSKKAN